MIVSDGMFQRFFFKFLLSTMDLIFPLFYNDPLKRRFHSLST